MWKVLIFPGGTENGLEIRKSLGFCKEVKVFSASSAVMNHAFYVYEKNHIIRDTSQAGWIDDLNRVIAELGIDLVYPANSAIIDVLSPVRHLVHAPILLPDHSVIELTRSKRKTLQVLKDVVPAPRVYRTAAEVTGFPVFSKPDRGYGAQGAEPIKDRHALDCVDFEKFVVQEYLPGAEYTVDCFSDRDGNLLFSGARERSRIRMATSMHAEPVDSKLDSLLRDYAKKILSKIQISGAWFFQVKMDAEGVLRLLEIDIRIAGTMCFNRCRGVNFPLLSVFQFFGKNVSILTNSQPLSLDRSLRNRYKFEYDYETVYVDLDDTIVVHDRLNTELVQFLYQCVNHGKKVVLLSKSLQSDKVGYLRRWRIYELFDEIVWLSEADSKADSIRPGAAIFIDDSFSQRLEVAQRLGIPTFDSSMIESLLDERI